MVCEQAEQPHIETTLRCCEGIQLPEGILPVVYIGHGGIFAIAQNAAKPDVLCPALRNLLGTSKIRLYVPDTGLFDPLRGKVGQVLDDDELEQQILSWTLPETPAWSQAQIESFEAKLKHATIFCQGRFIDQEGNTFALLRGTFRPLTTLSSEHMYYLTLFGGVFGFHRFYARKYASGLFYMLTGGWFGVGWFADLLSLLLGAQKDKQKRYFAPLDNRLVKLMLLPVGFCISLFLVYLYANIFVSLLSMMNSGAAAQIQSNDAIIASGAENAIENIVNTLTDFFGE